jgi:hypothetical protein
MTEGMKRCTKCGQSRPLNEFSKHSTCADGYGVYCRKCSTIQMREYRKTPAEKRSRFLLHERVKNTLTTLTKCCNRCKQEKPLDAFYKRATNLDGHHGECKKCFNVAQKEWLKTPDGKNRHFFAQEKHKYGLSTAQVNLLMQEDVCEICGRFLEGKLCVDHDHKTGIVRGVLCKRCNIALGCMNDDPHVFRKAAEYLEGNRKHNITPARVGSRMVKRKLSPAQELSDFDMVGTND